jgi:hypothetical protein
MKIYLTSIIIAISSWGCIESHIDRAIRIHEEYKNGVKTDLQLKVLNKVLICDVKAVDSLRVVNELINAKLLSLEMLKLDNPTFRIDTPMNLLLLKRKFEKSPISIVAKIYKCQIRIKNPFVNNAIQEYQKMFVISSNELRAEDGDFILENIRDANIDMKIKQEMKIK